MGPELSSLSAILQERQRLSIAGPAYPHAAVLLALCGPNSDDYCIPFTVRTFLVEHHKGEISFPGGVWEGEDESLEATALRESYEEVGIEPAGVRILGRLDDLVTRARIAVTPVVAHIPSPCPFVPSPQEVAEVLSVPLAHLLNPPHQVPDPRYPGRPLPCYQFGSHLIYGATARVLAQFLDLWRLAAARRGPGE